MVHKDVSKHPFDYALLLAGVLALTAAIYTVWPNRILQVQLGIGLGLFYTIWGTIHHWRLKNLTGRVFLEYAAFGLFVSLMIWFVLLYQ